MRIDDATFVVTDTETTGTSPSSDRVIELAAVKLCDGEVVDTFQQLINPGRAIPKRITQITGISTAMVYDARPIDAVLPDYLDFLGDGIFTAHNLSFDRNFINAELGRVGAPELDVDTLCTLRLARRLLPGLKSKGLSRLIQFYNLQVNGRHRALGDAEATATILQQFFSQLAFEHEIETVDELLTFQNRSYRQVRRTPNHIKTLREETLPEVPERPGVYFFKNSRGSMLYIGKAKRLSKRVRSYFNGIESHGARRRKLMQKVRQVEWTETTTELEALLLESRLIKKHKPSYNRAQRRYRGRPFIRLDPSEDVPKLSWSYTIQQDDAEYFGPLRNRDQAELVLEVAGRFYRLRECDDAKLRLGQRCLYADMDRCTAPCEGDDGAYAEEVARVRQFLTGQDRSVLDALQERMQQASANLEFEQAAQFRDWHDEIEHLLDRQQAIAAPVLEHNAVVALPGASGGAVQLFVVRFGRPVETVAVRLPPSDEARARLEAKLAHHFDPAQERPKQYSKRDVDEIRLLSHWLYVHRDEIAHVRWSADVSVDAWRERVEAAARATADVHAAERDN
jgi:DNA polymerase-3 subunit epsilon